MADGNLHVRHVAVYARVSTHDQDPDLQLRELREYVKRRGVSSVDEYTDHGFSGARDRRPALDGLMKDARRRRFEAVIVWKFDRWARSVRHLVTTLAEFRDLGIEFVSITEAIDTSTPIGRAMFAIVGAIAEFERELIRERVLSGMAKARAKGQHLGRRRADLNVETIRQCLASGMSLRAIARHLGVDRATVTRALERDGGANPSPESGLAATGEEPCCTVAIAGAEGEPSAPG